MVVVTVDFIQQSPDRTAPLECFKIMPHRGAAKVPPPLLCRATEVTTLTFIDRHTFLTLQMGVESGGRVDHCLVTTGAVRSVAPSRSCPVCTVLYGPSRTISSIMLRIVILVALVAASSSQQSSPGADLGPILKEANMNITNPVTLEGLDYWNIFSTWYFEYLVTDAYKDLIHRFLQDNKVSVKQLLYLLYQNSISTVIRPSTI